MPVAWLLAQPFEMWYPRRPAPEGDAEAIVVFSGSAQKPLPERPYMLAGADTYARTVHAAWLHKNWRPLPVLACGGGNLGEPFAVTMGRILEKEGVPRQMIWTEERSTSTFENAAFAAGILKRHNISRVALVTSAVHMPRSVMAFSQAGNLRDCGALLLCARPAARLPAAAGVAGDRAERGDTARGGGAAVVLDARLDLTGCWAAS